VGRISITVNDSRGYKKHGRGENHIMKTSSRINGPKVTKNKPGQENHRERIIYVPNDPPQMKNILKERIPGIK